MRLPFLTHIKYQVVRLMEKEGWSTKEPEGPMQTGEVFWALPWLTAIFWVGSFSSFIGTWAAQLPVATSGTTGAR